MLRLLATVLALQLLSGCADVGAGASPEVTPVATAHASPSLEPSPSPTPTEEPTVEPTPAISPSPSPWSEPSFTAGREASDLFWNNWYETCWFGADPVSSSLEEMVGLSDVVLRGPILDLHEGGTVTYAIVDPVDVLKGDPLLRQDGTVFVALGRAHVDLDELRSQLPAHDNLWFLKRDGITDRYYSTDYLQISVLRDIDGEVRVIWPSAIADAFSRRHYPLPLEGTSFEDIIQRVRDLVVGASREASLSFVARLSGPSALFAC
jgi:hypothetical protein